MADVKHTPGPWQVAGVRHSGDLKIGQDSRLHMVGPDNDAVAAVFFDMKTGIGLSDARLIAAAPDLLEALDALMDINDNGGPFGGEMYQDRVTRALDKARAAIAKAKGGV